MKNKATNQHPQQKKYKEILWANSKSEDTLTKNGLSYTKVKVKCNCTCHQNGGTHIVECCESGFKYFYKLIGVKK